ncbi:MAG: primosomal protein N' [Bacteroidia bacterium]|nr:primosomal protein N' [Bacteroidia bacterium]
MITEEEDHNRTTLFIEVILPLPIPKLFTYRVPHEWNELIVQGKRVFVPFGARKIYTAIIYNISSKKPEKYEALYILGILDDNPIVNKKQLDYWQWVSEYYMCPLGDVMSAALPAGLKLQSETVITLNKETVIDKSILDEREIHIIELLEKKPQLSISEIELSMKSKSSMITVIKSLYDRNLVLISEDVTESYKPKSTVYLKVTGKITEEGLNTQLSMLERRSKKQYEALLVLLSQPERQSERSVLLKQHNITSASVNALIEKGLILKLEISSDRINLGTKKDSDYFVLNKGQEDAYNSINKSFETHDVTLLYGVTGSGKTHIYVKLIQDAIKNGKQVLYLVPEIALTEQLIRKLEAYFSGIMAVSHSRFSKDEKVEIWSKVNSGEISLLVGARSALFMPFSNLGLIIVDEEHETSYKQNDKNPRYHARDAAVMLAKQWKIKTVLGSATPSFESFFLAKEGKYGLVSLPERYSLVPMPQIIIGNIKEDTRTKEIKAIFTKAFMDNLNLTLDTNRQAIIFQNRKGYVPQVICDTCQWTPKCINCDITLTYYKYSNNLRCHYCSYHQATIVKCEACGSNNMKIKGYGTERITEDVEILFPKARIRRFDQDSTRQKYAFKNLIAEFEQHKTDVLVGTQIVAKGLDFEGVHMAAVVNADQLLHFPDFRANERAFQLMVQLSGRAGRRDKQGVVVIQTYDPENKVIKLVQENNYEGLYESEIKERKDYFYPPYSRMIRLTIKHKDPIVLEKASDELAAVLKKRLGLRVLGPENPYVSKIRNQYLKNIIIKLDREKDPVPKIKQWMQGLFLEFTSLAEYKALIIQPDVDAY